MTGKDTRKARTQPADRFWAMVEKTDTCWLWTGRRDKDGYGKFAEHMGIAPVPAHRYAFVLTYGPIEPLPDGRPAPIDHLCSTRACVRPDHLERVTPRENVMRAKANFGLMICQRCGAEVQRTSNVQKRCPDCRREIKRAAGRAYHARHRTAAG